MFGFLTFFKERLNRVTKTNFRYIGVVGRNNSIERNSVQNLLYFSICPHLVLNFRFSHLGSQFQYLHLNSKLQYNHLLSQSFQLKFKISVSALTLRIPLAAYLSFNGKQSKTVSNFMSHTKLERFRIRFYAQNYPNFTFKI